MGDSDNFGPWQWERYETGRRNGTGFWNNPRPKLTRETRELLEVLMEESKLTLLQRHHLRHSAQRGSLPLELLSDKDSVQCSKSNVSTRPSTSSSVGLRSRDTIIRSGAYERPIYVPDSRPVRGGSEEKERLCNLMAYGKATVASNAVEDEPPEVSANPKRDIGQLDPTNQIAAEIEERRAFLHEMKSLGLEKKYRAIMNAEISQRLRELEILKKKRNIIQDGASGAIW